MKTCKRSIDARARRLVETAVKLARSTRDSAGSGGPFDKLLAAERLAKAAQREAAQGMCRDASTSMRQASNKLTAARQMIRRVTPNAKGLR